MALKRTTRTLLARSKARKKHIVKDAFNPTEPTSTARARAARHIKSFKKRYGAGVASKAYIKKGHHVLRDKNGLRGTQLDRTAARKHFIKTTT